MGNSLVFWRSTGVCVDSGMMVLPVSVARCAAEAAGAPRPVSANVALTPRVERSLLCAGAGVFDIPGVGAVRQIQ